MSEETSAPAGGEAIASAPAEIPAELSIDEAVRFYTQPKKPESTAESAEAEKPATAEHESPEREDADPEKALGEEPEADEPAEELPPIDRPRSWSKDDDDDWNALPRARQEKIAANERAREADIRQRINEIAEQRNAVKAEREAAEKVRQEYDTKLPALSKTLESALQNEFADIKSFDDLRVMQRDDPFRYQQWDLRQKELSAVKQEEQAAEQRQAAQRMTKRSQYEAEQNKLLIELVPDMADPKKAVELRERAVTMLTDDLGMKRDQLERWMADDTGHEILSNAGIQKLIADGLKYRDILSAPKAIAAKPVPPVQKPGAAAPRGTQASERIQALQKTFEREPSLDNAMALRLARLKRA